MRQILHDVWVEVDLSALKRNARQVLGLIGDNCKLIAVVKANGYGHGYVEPAKAFLSVGAYGLAVTRLDEALVLRDAGIESPILALAPVLPGNLQTAIDAHIDLTVTGVDQLKAVSEQASKAGTQARVHLKIDTGMGRLGALPTDVPSIAAALRELPSLSIAGVFTHFAGSADKDISGSKAQFEVFQNCLATVHASGTTGFMAHAANSAAAVRLPESRLNAVRVGTLLYGQYPSEHVHKKADVKSGWRLKARICEVRDLPVGAKVGYGGEFTCRRPTRTALIPVGFADGYTLAPEGPIYRQGALEFAARKAKRQLHVEINEKRAPVIGRVAMQMIAVDVTDIEGVAVGTEAIIPCMRIPSSALLPRVYVDSV